MQILLPLCNAEQQAFPPQKFERLARELTEKFGGLTSFMRTPGDGRWKNGSATEHDDIVVIEVMTHDVDRDWWAGLRKRLAREFDQDEVIIRCQEIEPL